MTGHKNTRCSVVRNAAQRYNRGMSTRKKMNARSKIIEAIRALPTYAAREAWANKLGHILYEMQK